MMGENKEVELEKEAIFYQKLLIECQKKRKSVNQIERELGYPRNALHNYKNGRNPSGERLVELSEYFDVSPKYLIGRAEPESFYSIHQFFEGLNTKEKREMSDLCHQWLMFQVD